MISAIPSRPSNALDPYLIQQIEASNAHFFKKKLVPSRSDSLETIMKKAEGIFEEIQKGYSYYALGRSFCGIKEIKLSLIHMRISRENRGCRIGFSKARSFPNMSICKKEDSSLFIACHLLLSTEKYKEMLTVAKTQNVYGAGILVEGLHMVSLARFAEKGVYEKEFFEFMEYYLPHEFMIEYTRKAFSIGLHRFSLEIDKHLITDCAEIYIPSMNWRDVKKEIDERMRKRYVLQLIMALSKDSHDLKHAPEAKQETC